MVRILITGNMGYVGPIVARHLRRTRPDAFIVGFDSAFFAHCLTGQDLPERVLNQQRFGDVRDFGPADLEGFDAVVCLPAITNDPIGKKFETVTDEINHRSCVRTAALARAAGVKSFVFASSCMVYGFAADGRPRREADALDPMTAYARSKIDTENALRQMPTENMNITCLRFATACGMSDRLRLDLLVNDFVASAVASGEITVLSDGSSWRPLIDVRDMARAIDWAIGRDEQKGGGFLSVNAGSDQWNYQVRDLAHAVAAEVAGTHVSINKDAQPGQRSCRVDFGLFRKLAVTHQPQINLAESVRTLANSLKSMGFADKDFRNSDLIRLGMLERHMERGVLSDTLRWVS
jgi:nucleoside-diphosphate-sugar epimerase